MDFSNRSFAILNVNLVFHKPVLWSLLKINVVYKCIICQALNYITQNVDSSWWCEPLTKYYEKFLRAGSEQACDPSLITREEVEGDRSKTCTQIKYALWWINGFSLWVWNSRIGITFRASFIRMWLNPSGLCHRAQNFTAKYTQKQQTIHAKTNTATYTSVPKKLTFIGATCVCTGLYRISQLLIQFHLLWNSD